MTLADVSSRLSDISERYQVPERVGAASQKVYEGMSAAGEAASKAAAKGAEAAYRYARANPRTSIGAVIVVAALVGGALWYMFGHERKPLQRRRRVARVRAGTERRKHHRASRAAAA